MFSTINKDKEIIDYARSNEFDKVFVMLDSNSDLIKAEYFDWRRFTTYDLLSCAINNKNILACAKLLERENIHLLIDKHVSKAHVDYKPGDEPEGRLEYFVSNFLQYICQLDIPVGILDVVLTKIPHDINEYDYFYSNSGPELDSSDAGGVAHRSYSTTLSIAIRFGNADIAKRLLQEQAIDVNKCDREDHDDIEKSPLYIACESGKTDIVRELLSHPKININLGYRRKWCSSTDEIISPLEVAMNNGHQEIVNLLCDAMKIDRISLVRASCVIM